MVKKRVLAAQESCVDAVESDVQRQLFNSPTRGREDGDVMESMAAVEDFQTKLAAEVEAQLVDDDDEVEDAATQPLPTALALVEPAPVTPVAVAPLPKGKGKKRKACEITSFDASKGGKKGGGKGKKGGKGKEGNKKRRLQEQPTDEIVSDLIDTHCASLTERQCYSVPDEDGYCLVDLVKQEVQSQRRTDKRRNITVPETTWRILRSKFSKMMLNRAMRVKDITLKVDEELEAAIEEAVVRLRCGMLLRWICKKEKESTIPNEKSCVMLCRAIGRLSPHRPKQLTCMLHALGYIASKLHAEHPTLTKALADVADIALCKEFSNSKKSSSPELWTKLYRERLEKYLIWVPGIEDVEKLISHIDMPCDTPGALEMTQICDRALSKSSVLRAMYGVYWIEWTCRMGVHVIGELTQQLHGQWMPADAWKTFDAACASALGKSYRAEVKPFQFTACYGQLPLSKWVTKLSDAAHWSYLAVERFSLWKHKKVPSLHLVESQHCSRDDDESVCASGVADSLASAPHLSRSSFDVACELALHAHPTGQASIVVNTAKSRTEAQKALDVHWDFDEALLQHCLSTDGANENVESSALAIIRKHQDSGSLPRLLKELQDFKETPMVKAGSTSYFQVLHMLIADVTGLNDGSGLVKGDLVGERPTASKNPALNFRARAQHLINMYRQYNDGNVVLTGPCAQAAELKVLRGRYIHGDQDLTLKDLNEVRNWIHLTNDPDDLEAIDEMSKTLTKKTFSLLGLSDRVINIHDENGFFITDAPNVYETPGSKKKASSNQTPAKNRAALARIKSTENIMAALKAP